MGGTHDYRRTWDFDSWSDYWKNTKLVNDFIEEYPNE